MTKNEKEKPRFILDYIRSLPSPLEQAKYLSAQDWKTLNKISQTDKNYYQNNFREKLKTLSLSSEDYKTLLAGLSALKNK